VPHSVKQEEDPCHRLIYHSDKENGCGHDSHYIVSDQCEMCDLAIQSDQSLISSVTIHAPIYFQQPFAIYKDNLDSYQAVISSSRAPPVHI
jgi:hypothetical protein